MKYALPLCLALAALAVSSACGGGEGEGEHGGGGAPGEESGAQLAKDETWDRVRAGVRLVIAWDAAANAFAGTVTNTTSGPLSRVRVEVHLSNGVELGPTAPVDLAPGQAADVTLPAGALPFATWSAHPEVGGGAGGGEHAGEDDGEHGVEGEDGGNGG